MMSQVEDGTFNVSLDSCGLNPNDFMSDDESGSSSVSTICSPAAKNSRKASPDGTTTGSRKKVKTSVESKGINSQEWNLVLESIASNTFMTIRELKEIQIDSVVDKVVVGFIVCVRRHWKDDQSNVIRSNELIVDVVDPSSDEISIHISRANIGIGNIVKFNAVSVSRTGTGIIYVSKSLDMQQIPSFVFDYKQDNLSREDEMLSVDWARKFFSTAYDRKLAEWMEEWLANYFVDQNNLAFCLSDSARGYINFGCQVLAVRDLGHSLILTITDGRKHRHNIVDPLERLTSVYELANKPVSIKTFNKEFYPYGVKKYAYVQVWRNTPSHPNDHFSICDKLTLLNGDDLLVFFNVEVNRKQENDVELHLRSGQQHGKAVRIVKRNSAMGRRIMEPIMKVVKKHDDAAEMDEEGSNMDFDSSLLNATTLNCMDETLRDSSASQVAGPSGFAQQRHTVEPLLQESDETLPEDITVDIIPVAGQSEGKQYAYKTTKIEIVEDETDSDVTEVQGDILDLDEIPPDVTETGTLSPIIGDRNSDTTEVSEVPMDILVEELANNVSELPGKPVTRSQMQRIKMTPNSKVGFQIRNDQDRRRLKEMMENADPDPPFLA